MKKIFFIIFCLSQLASFSQSINFNGNLGNITTCNTNFYDSGGSTSNYQNAEDYTVTFYPVSGGNVQITFTTFSTELNWDSLQVFNGPTTNIANRIGNFHGNLQTPFQVTANNPDGCLTLVWKSDFSINNYAGWEAILACTLPPLLVSANATPSACNAADGSLMITVSGGIPPYTYTWANGATTQNLSNLAPSAYTLTVYDSTGYSVTNTFYINSANLTASPTITTAACDSTGGSIQLALSGGTAPYTISWNTGDTGNPFNNLSPNGYSANIYDANGCFAHWAGLVELDDSCTITIAGKVYNDLNGNCVQDVGESSISNAFVNLTPGGGSFTDPNGAFEFEVVPGSYTIQYFANPFHNTSACANGLVQNLPGLSYGMNAYNQDFPIQFTAVQDLSITLYDNGYVPGANHNTHIYYHNNGSMAMSPTITWTHDSLITPTTYSLLPTTYNATTRTATWNIASLASLSNGTIHITSLTDTTATLGTLAGGNVQITPTNGDATLYNNQDTTAGAVATSFDPNDKKAYPTGTGNYHFIDPANNLLHYTVNFQNTGTYPASYVMVRDTLDANLDAFSVQVGLVSHPYTLALENDNILVFRFYNINLADSFSNEPASHGFINYTVLTNPNLALGTRIENSASIYFDFNVPVKTNTTFHTIYLAPYASTDINMACVGDPVTAQVVKGVPPYSYSWSSGITSNNNSATSFVTNQLPVGANTVYIQDAFGVVSNTTPVYVDAAPTDATFTYAIVGDTLFLMPNTIQSSLAYDWDFGNGQTSSAMYPFIIIDNTTSSYNVTLSILNLCGSVNATETIMMSDISSPFQSQVHLFPNPMSDQATLSVDFPTQKPYNVQITDITGKVVKKWENIKTQNVTIYKDELVAGTYFVELKGEVKVVKRLIIK